MSTTAKRIAAVIPARSTFVTTTEIADAANLTTKQVGQAGRCDLVEINRHLHPRGVSVGYINGQWDIFSLTRETALQSASKALAAAVVKYRCEIPTEILTLSLAVERALRGA